MKIETRFDIGDEVWYVWLEPGRCAECGQCVPGARWTVVRSTIAGISFRVHIEYDDPPSRRPEYWTNDPDHAGLVAEDHVFSCPEEALAEAIRLNEEAEAPGDGGEK